MKNIVILMIGFLLVGGICLLVGMNITENTISYEEVEKEQPMLMVMFDSWAENLDDSSESIFFYNILNFGNREAKNVVVRCEVSDIDGNFLREEFFNIGNVASNSYEYQESVMKYSGNTLQEYGICYMDSADGDYINLYDRLLDLN